jgi:hypothetical protein
LLNIPNWIDFPWFNLPLITTYHFFPLLPNSAENSALSAERPGKTTDLAHSPYPALSITFSAWKAQGLLIQPVGVLVRRADFNSLGEGFLV